MSTAQNGQTCSNSWSATAGLFDHFVGLTLKWLNSLTTSMQVVMLHQFSCSELHFIGQNQLVIFSRKSTKRKFSESAVVSSLLTLNRYLPIGFCPCQLTLTFLTTSVLSQWFFVEIIFVYRISSCKISNVLVAAFVGRRRLFCYYLFQYILERYCKQEKHRFLTKLY